jgi:hypothetical protein
MWTIRMAPNSALESCPRSRAETRRKLYFFAGRRPRLAGEAVQARPRSSCAPPMRSEIVNGRTRASS